ncbi:hypothetical protein IWZ00DRAFT_321241 [Phyllosticta capitalensis]|uniref:Uncharacterized protein n=1 Tax=Phyllosticta capitalensis TaxID=121624 RepID=A0ABR1YK06_9PEZI
MCMLYCKSSWCLWFWISSSYSHGVSTIVSLLILHSSICFSPPSLPLLSCISAFGLLVLVPTLGSSRLYRWLVIHCSHPHPARQTHW